MRGGHRIAGVIPLTEADKIQALADAGWNYHRLSKLYNVSWSAMQRYFKRNGLTYGIGHDGKLIVDRPTKPVAEGMEEALYGTRTYEDVPRLELRLERIWEVREASLTPKQTNVAARHDPLPGRVRA